MDEVARSNRVGSTSFFHTFREIGAFYGGLIAGEGCFSAVTRPEQFRTGEARVRFVFAIALASRDRPLLEGLQMILGGNLRDQPARYAHWQPTTDLSVASMSRHRSHTIPFMEEFLVAGHKRAQFLDWRRRLDRYAAEHPPRMRSICSVDGCQRFVRGRGLCRSHYYQATGY